MRELWGKLLGIVAAAAMLLTGFAGASVAFAVDDPTSPTSSITITGSAKDTEYAAYKLLDATSLGADSSGKTTYAFSIATGMKNALVAGLNAVLGEDEQVNAQTKDSELIAKLEGLQNSKMPTFAKKVYESLSSATPAATVTADEIGEDDATYTATFSNLDYGYYLVAQTSTPADGDAASAIIVQTAGVSNVEVAAKKDVPTMEKKVQEKNDSKATGTTDPKNPTDWQDGADYDIGDDVPFQITATLPDSASDFAAYETYKLVFHDKESAGLSFNNDAKLYLNTVSDATEIPAGNYTVATTGLDANETFRITINDVKAMKDSSDNTITVNAGDKIIVRYTSELNSSAVIGSAGNPNEARLEYSNNPNEEGTGHTPWDKVIVFTYTIQAKKVHEVNGSNQPLEGAGFTLYKWIADADNGKGGKGAWQAVGSEITGMTTFSFTGVDAGTYKLVESKVPSGYNKADDIEFTVAATYDTSSDDPKLTGLTVTPSNAGFTCTPSTGVISTDVMNRPGSELPSTGGMGTAMLYLAGFTLVAAAVGGLIIAASRRRRMN